ncbi:NAD(P)-dependent dehydrogenase (short-subunit alcohol dehydrogenase family) [Sinobacterium caligoides]|uniref:NAD(P)-dependent dehydrogenase (Short-subunit alcohol dehydrogenase family) n=1 Tax=Sinobacterium caligoides TaxID=933926 RepID=A0A3N2DZR6_9GAMM|nr:YciK family oxidoreductase [Sinobacterium caligoides]ROS05142.1 NAD(P)-dependent dehydrogenase (short-subunit alcohol dehydrogenase family) [Sinobacterium caligoides]
MLDYQARPDLLKGKTILVTGAGAGIGRAAAISYAAHGATVILAGRTVEKLEAVYDEIEQAGNPQPAIYPIDFKTATDSDYQQMANQIAASFEQLDGVLHNASQLGQMGPIESSHTATFMQTLQVNLNAPYMLTRYLIPLLREAEHASVIFTSSSVGRKGRAYWGSYCVSKFATEGLMQVLADELENVSNIRVNTLNPGATNTAMRRTAFPAERPTTNPFPEQLMPAYLYLMGEDSLNVNGQALNAQPIKATS